MIARPPRRADVLHAPRPARADGIALALVTVLGLATLATLFRFFQFVAWA